MVFTQKVRHQIWARDVVLPVTTGAPLWRLGPRRPRDFPSVLLQPFSFWGISDGALFAIPSAKWTVRMETVCGEVNEET
jgi:hypothetical protein